MKSLIPISRTILPTVSPSMPGVRLPLLLATRFQAHLKLRGSVTRVPQFSVRFVGICFTPLIHLSLNAENPGSICRVIQVHGLYLRLRKGIDSLPAFAMWTVFPTSDYYTGSVLALLHFGPLPIAYFRSRRRRTSSHVPISDL